MERRKMVELALGVLAVAVVLAVSADTSYAGDRGRHHGGSDGWHSYRPGPIVVYERSYAPVYVYQQPYLPPAYYYQPAPVVVYERACRPAYYYSRPLVGFSFRWGH